VEGDLDWIVMKCLEKERSRRYETASALAADVGRHLQNEPVLACPPDTLYRFNRWIRRHQATFASLVAVAVVLLGGTVFSTWQAIRAHRGEARANAALTDLRASAPAFAAQARELARQRRFDEAIAKFDYAIKLRSDKTEYRLGKGNLLQSQLQFTEAAQVYQELLELAPTEPLARTNLFLSRQLTLSSDPPSPAWYSALDRLYAQMLRERRSTGEISTVAMLVSEHWQERLESVPISPGHSLEERLKLTVFSTLELNLKGLVMTDLNPIRGLPLSLLDAVDQPITDLRPLERMPLKALSIDGTRVQDLRPLQGMHTLKNLALRSSMITDLSPLRGLSLTWLDMTSSPVADLSPLRGMPLTCLRVRNTRVRDLSPLAGMPLDELDCTSIPARDISVLSSCRALTQVYLSHMQLRTLESLRGLPLTDLRCDNTGITNIAPLAGAPLILLRLNNTGVTDLTPLLECPTLQSLGLPAGAENVSVLQALPQLRWISDKRDARGAPGQTATEFWRELASAEPGTP